MKQKQRPLTAIRLSAQLCFLALALSGISVAQATSATQTTSPEVAAESATAHKAAARAHAEKLRAIREAKELERDQAAANSIAEPSSSSPGTRKQASIDDSIFPDIGNALAAATPDLSAQRIATEAELYISAAVNRLGLSPKLSAGTAGFLVGMSGPWVYSRVMGPTVSNTAMLDSLALEAAGAGASYLEGQYSLAERAGRGARYLMMAFMAAGLLFVGHNALSRRTARVSRPTSKLGKSPSDMSDKTLTLGTLMFGILRRKSAKKELTHETAQAVVVAFDMDTLRDYAFNLLFARGRHDLAGVGDMVTPSFARCLQSHFQALEAKGRWNKVERVCGVKCREVESWLEGDTSYAKMHVSWKALDYVVNFNRRPGEAGYLVDGDSSKMEEFYEEWVVTRKAGGTWLVDAMYPANNPNPLVK